MIKTNKGTTTTSPISVKLVANVKHLVMAIARLHNFCVDERISRKAVLNNQVVVFTPTNVAFDFHSTMLRDTAAIEDFKQMVNEFEVGRCYNRERMVEEVQALQLTRPGMEGRRGRISRQ